MAITDVLRKALDKWSPHGSSQNFNLDDGDTLNINAESNRLHAYSHNRVNSHSHTFNTYSPNTEPSRRPFKFLLPINRTQEQIREEELNAFGKSESKLGRVKSKSEAKLERAKSKKESKLERERSKKDSKLERTKSKIKQNTLRTRPRPQHMERMESFSWKSESVTSTGGCRDGENWDKRSDVSRECSSPILYLFAVSTASSMR